MKKRRHHKSRRGALYTGKSIFSPIILGIIYCENHVFSMKIAFPLKPRILQKNANRILAYACAVKNMPWSPKSPEAQETQNPGKA